MGIASLSFLVFLSAFVLIGVSSLRKSRGSHADYYLASNTVSPWLVGLSAMATNNSGYMFIGVIGYTYTTGLASIWLMLGWIAGDFLASLFVHRRLRVATERSGEVSFGGVLSHWTGNGGNTLQRVAAMISLLFMLAYASAQLVAGGKALHVLFDWPLWMGAVMGSALVVVYCLAGGIRASIWTDAAQAMVMVAAMSVLLVVATNAQGGLASSIASMRGIDGFLDWFPRDLALPGLAGGLLFALSWLFAGLSVIGQPHIMVRFMALDDSAKMLRARAWYYGWYFVFYALATGVGMMSRLFIADPGNFDAELALPTMAQMLLPSVLVGLVLAGIFAATLSTADSLILGCSATLSHDMLPHRLEKTWMLKLTTFGVTAAALLWALTNQQTVFGLVVMAWSGLASSFAPLLLVLALGGRPNERLAIVMMVIGLGTALLWRYLGLHDSVYEGMPGILAGLLAFGLGRLAGLQRAAELRRA